MADDEFYLGSLRVDLLGRRVWIKGEPRVLSRAQFDLLLALGNPPGRAVPYDELYNAVWRVWPTDWNQFRNLAGLACRLRKTIGAEYIDTLWGYGFRLHIEDDREDRPPYPTS